MAKLRLVDDNDILQIFDISQGGIFGRDPDAQFIVDHPTVSRRHVEFCVRQGEIEIQDLTSANGTLLNGRALDCRPYQLEHGDQLQFGALIASFHAAGAETDPTLQRRPGAKGSRALTVTGNALEYQMRLGRLAQRRMLVDRPPEILGYELGHLFLPALGVGGDFIFWGRAADGRHALVIGDVCGKGVAAALYMAYVCGLLAEIVPTSRSAVSILERANRNLHPIMEPGMFVTAFALLLDPLQHQLELACAGHEPALLKRSSGIVSDISIGAGLALGHSAEADIGGTNIHLDVGEVVVLFTDGVDEAQNTEQESFGRWRIADILAHCAGAIDAARRLQSAVNRHATGSRQHDDITVVTLERAK